MELAGGGDGTDGVAADGLTNAAPRQEDSHGAFQPADEIRLQQSLYEINEQISLFGRFAVYIADTAQFK